MKPNLTRTFDQTITTPEYGPVRLAVTLNAWLPQEIDPSDDELKVALKDASAVVEKMLFQIEAEPVKPSCETCRFFAYLSCRRRSPTKQQQFGDPRWPMTQADDWCGEFEASQGRP